MPGIEEFIKLLQKGEQKFLSEYLPEIESLLKSLDSDNLLNIGFTKDQIKRLLKFNVTMKAAVDIYGNYNKIITFDEKETKERIGELKKIGLNVDNIAEQYCASMCQMYQAAFERLKIHMLTLIKHSVILHDGNIHFARLLDILKKKYDKNNFLKYLHTQMRNPVAHYTYFFENGNIYLCKTLFDSSPILLSFDNFMMETKKLNILGEAFFLSYLDYIQKQRTK